MTRTLCERKPVTSTLCHEDKITPYGMHIYPGPSIHVKPKLAADNWVDVKRDNKIRNLSVPKYALRQYAFSTLHHLQIPASRTYMIP